MIGKHFPGHIGISISPHYGLPVSYKGYSELIKEIIPYPSLKDYLDGIMTAHIVFPIIKNAAHRFVTTSKLLVHDTLRGANTVSIGDDSYQALGFDDHVVMTDDLSSMTAISDYMRQEKIPNLSDLVYRSLLAGHDMILLCSVSGNKKDSSLHFDDIDKVYNTLVSAFKEKGAPVSQLRDSVKRIIKLKAELFHEGGKHSLFPKAFTSNYDPDFFMPQFLVEENYESIDNFYKEITRTAMTKIHETSDIKSRYKMAKKICVVNFIDSWVPPARKNSIETFYRKELVGKEVSFITEVRMQQPLTTIKKLIQAKIADNDLVLINLTSPHEIGLVAEIAKLGENAADQIVFFFHCSPKLFPWEYLNRFNLFGCFSEIEQSYFADIDYLKDDIKTLPVSKLPLALGDNGSFNSISEESRKPPANPMSPHFGTPFEKEALFTLNKQLREQNEKLEQKNNTLESDYSKTKRALLICYWLIFFGGWGYAGLTVYRYLSVVDTSSNSNAWQGVVGFVQAKKFFFRFLFGIGVIIVSLAVGELSGVQPWKTIKTTISYLKL